MPLQFCEVLSDDLLEGVFRQLELEMVYDITAFIVCIRVDHVEAVEVFGCYRLYPGNFATGIASSEIAAYRLPIKTVAEWTFDASFEVEVDHSDRHPTACNQCEAG